MVQTALDFTDLGRLPRPGAFFRYNSQNYRIYEKLLAGGITSAEMRRDFIMSHTKRISDIRERLIVFGYDVECQEFHGNINIWKIRKMELKAA